MVSFVLGQLCVAHGNLSCRKGRMLPHAGLFLLWKVALQMRIRRRLKNHLQVFRQPFFELVADINIDNDKILILC